jgi:hypothetical protein
MNRDNFIKLPEQTRINAFTEVAARRALSFNRLLDKIKQLNERVNQLEWEKP